ncbi:MAG TPA: aspartate kinase [Lacibacter sp.]|nr:aspartate kinase [Lacibacter sp.]HMO89074.1 aspartate kinase [Lacibacter sp.]HMP87941.1 aspartate kinase [Lacibacter sp.]
MQVFKFGGASVRNHEKIENLGRLLQRYPGEPLLIVLSAMGKTTNALEKVAEAFFAGKRQEALDLFRAVKLQHLDEAKYLLVTHFNALLEQFTDFFTEVEWLLHDEPVRSYDYYYDQIVCVGELLSTALVCAYLNESGMNATWLDVRDIIRTNNNFRDAGIDWPLTQEQVIKTVHPLLTDNRVVITQGFIGCTDENESTTLGREGSDYTAALFAHMLNVQQLTIWKDVPGVMNADPRLFPDARLIPDLNYDEVIEMAYYGAQVLHPKTIKPLQNKNIPLLVKCFDDADLPGTRIHNQPVKHLPPIIVWKQQQVLLDLHTRDFSFVGEQPISDLYRIMAQLHVRPNLLQIHAVNLQICLDERNDKLEQLAHAAAGSFDVQIKRGLSLLSIRYYSDELVQRLTEGKTAVLVQRSRDTIQLLLY